MSPAARAVAAPVQTSSTREGLPTWLNVMTGMVAASNLLVFGLLAFAEPNLVFPDLNVAGEYPARFFAIRHIAIALPLLHGLTSQDRSVLKAMYHMFLIIAALDVGSVLWFDWSYPFIGQQPFLVELAIGLSLFVLPMAAGVRALRART